MERLAAVSNEIKVATAEQIAGDRKVVDAVRSVYGVSGKNRQSTEKLKNILSRFKLR